MIQPLPRLSLLIFIGLLVCAGARPAELTAQQQRGRQIYQEGLDSVGQPVSALLNGDNTPLPGPACAGCHGRDGRGKPEAGYNPSDLRWRELTRASTASNNSGRSHPPYSDHFLIRAITLGIDPAGNHLDNAMPRFQLRLSDAEDLLSYLRVLGDLNDDGIDGSSIKIGVLLPSPKRMPALNREVRGILTRYFAGISSRGGIYARRIDVVFADLPDALERAPEAVKAFLGQTHPFALVASFLAGAEEPIAAVANQQGIPVIAAFTWFPHEPTAARDYVFYVDAGLAGEAESLAAYARKNLPGSHTRMAACVSEAPSSSLLTQSIRKSLDESAIPLQILPASICQRSPQQLATLNIGAVFWTSIESGPDTFIRAAAAKSWAPLVLVPGSLFARPPVASEHLVVSSSQTAAGAKAVAAAQVFVEALTRSGHDVSRESLIQTLEGIYDFETGYSQTLRFGPGRHVGSNGSRVLTLDPPRR
ncbi:MAG TPA: ABC transporter substrate-binding protein [Bryobacteraceae bacterium]